MFGIPFFFESDAELAHVQQKLTPMIAQRLQAKKFHLINWGNAGWVQLFSKNPIRSIADLKRAKLYTGEGSPKMVQWYTSNGFHVVPLSAGEIPKQLKLPTGAIDAAPSPPVFALTLQFFRDAPYMLDIRVAPLTSATVMTDSAWNKISPDDRTKMLEAAKAMETADPGAGAGARRQVHQRDEGGRPAGRSRSTRTRSARSAPPPRASSRPSAATWFQPTSSTPPSRARDAFRTVEGGR